ncbi:MAG: YdbL family protein [Parasphingopyxis sp.]|nr:YdbL family protein [Sphingomonadales bacterium]
MTNKFKAIAIAAAGLAALGGGIALAQDGVVQQAVAAGQVGETAEGYLGFAQPPAAELRDLVDAINLRRRSAYSEIAERTGQTRQQVALETACSRLDDLRPGYAYQLRDGVWRTRGNAPIPTPSYC